MLSANTIFSDIRQVFCITNWKSMKPKINTKDATCYAVLAATGIIKSIKAKGLHNQN